ncbi:hypothetical protein XFF6990_320009 [Xanthomonas citri pv. fuscans]|nr:hypothetical protein XFF6990_320009 [Xanthomonas citri pv. fuscans]
MRVAVPSSAPSGHLLPAGEGNGALLMRYFSAACGRVDARWMRKLARQQTLGAAPLRALSPCAAARLRVALSLQVAHRHGSGSLVTHNAQRTTHNAQRTTHNA